MCIAVIKNWSVQDVKKVLLPLAQALSTIPPSTTLQAAQVLRPPTALVLVVVETSVVVAHQGITNELHHILDLGFIGMGFCDIPHGDSDLHRDCGWGVDWTSLQVNLAVDAWL